MENTKKSFGQILSELTSEQAEYLKNYINKQITDADNCGYAEGYNDAIAKIEEEAKHIAKYI